MKFITKYNYIQYKHCPKHFALDWFSFSSNDKGPDPVKDFLTTQGKEVGLLAQDLLKNEGYQFEQIFTAHDLSTRVDAIHREAGVLTEIKSTTSVKDDHLLDLAFQKHVLDQAQVQISTLKLGHLNKSYKRAEKLDLKELFHFKDVTREVAPILLSIESDLNEMRKIISSKTIPDCVIGSHCEKTHCPYVSLCWNDCKDYSVFNLRRDSHKKFELFKNGIHFIKDIPEYVELTHFQKIQKEAETQGCAVIDHHAVAEALHEVIPPISFLDFEAFAEAAPRYAGLTPYQQIPFQASLYVLLSPKHKARHHGFLHEEDSDPRGPLLDFLLKICGTTGTIVVYSPFEKARLYELIKFAPEKEAEILALIDRFWDLEKIFSKGFYVHPKAKGSSSIKKILPIFSDLSYENMPINNGLIAEVEYLRMIAPQTSPEEREKIKSELIAYNTQDTLAMVLIYKKLLEVL